MLLLNSFISLLLLGMLAACESVVLGVAYYCHNQMLVHIVDIVRRTWMGVAAFIFLEL